MAIATNEQQVVDSVPKQLYIGGEWRDGSEGGTIEVEDPATQEVLFKLGLDTYARSNKADALVVSCGGLRTLDLIVPLEKAIAVPVVSSTPHGLMNGVRLLGVSPRVQGFGMIFATA